MTALATAALKDAGSWYEHLADPAGRWFLARTHLGTLQPERQLTHGARIQVLFHGDLWNAVTLAEGVSFLPPASALRYSVADGTISVTRYRERFAWLRPADPSGDGNARERIFAAFRQAVARITTGGHKLRLSLSGGLDSRAILVAIDCTAPPVATRTVRAMGSPRCSRSTRSGKRTRGASFVVTVPSWRRPTAPGPFTPTHGLASLPLWTNSRTRASRAAPMAGRMVEALNRMVKRLHVPSFRHYHDFDAWMAERLIEPTQSLLPAKDASAREIFRDSTLERIAMDTRGGNRRRGYLLQLLLVLEPWQQENFA